MRYFAYVFIGMILGLLLYSGIDYLYSDKEQISESQNQPISFEEIVEPDSTPKIDHIEGSRHTAITTAVSIVNPAVVSVSVNKIRERVQRSPFYGDPFFERYFPEIYKDRIYKEKVESLGSGFIISTDGYIVTNDHVAGDGVEIVISTSQGDEFPAKLIGRDFLSDIALLKVDGHTFTPVKLGSSNDLLIGEWTIALGSPFGLFKRNKPTVTVGVISATDRDFGLVDEGRIYQDMIQTDAAINMGNSGGPLVNAAGEVIGMNTFIYTGDQYSSGSVGIGFAIPIDRIKEIVSGIKENKLDRDYWVGLSYLPINRFIASEMKYPKQQGIYISRIAHNSPAEKAGLKLGDILVEINNLSVFDANSVTSAMGTKYLKVGDTLPLKVWRDGQVIPINIILEKREN